MYRKKYNEQEHTNLNGGTYSLSYTGLSYTATPCLNIHRGLIYNRSTKLYLLLKCTKSRRLLLLPRQEPSYHTAACTQIEYDEGVMRSPFSEIFFCTSQIPICYPRIRC